MRQIVGDRSALGQAASTPQMRGRETEGLSSSENPAALASLRRQWIVRFLGRTGLKCITLDMDSSATPSAVSDCPAGASATTRCGSSFTRWPAIPRGETVEARIRAVVTVVVAPCGKKVTDLE